MMGVIPGWMDLDPTSREGLDIIGKHHCSIASASLREHGHVIQVFTVFCRVNPQTLAPGETMVTVLPPPIPDGTDLAKLCVREISAIGDAVAVASMSEAHVLAVMPETLASVEQWKRDHDGSVMGHPDEVASAIVAVESLTVRQVWTAAFQGTRPARSLLPWRTCHDPATVGGDLFGLLQGGTNSLRVTCVCGRRAMCIAVAPNGQKPKPADFMLCGGCSRILRMRADGQLVEARASELLELARDKRTQLEAVQAAIRSKLMAQRARGTA